METDSNQITGRIRRPNTFSGGPTILVMARAFCMARRLGTSSPSTRERKAITSVMPIRAPVAAADSGSPAAISSGAIEGAMVEAP